MIIPMKPSIDPIDRSIFRVTMTSTMPVAMMATDEDCTDRFHKLRGVRNKPPESRWKPIQINANAPTMPSMRVSSSVALRKRAAGKSDRVMVSSRLVANLDRASLHSLADLVLPDPTCTDGDIEVVPGDRDR